MEGAERPQGAPEAPSSSPSPTLPGPSLDCSLSPLRKSGGARLPGMESSPGIGGDYKGLGDLRPPLWDWYQVLHFLLHPVPPLLAQPGTWREKGDGNKSAHTLLPGFLRRAPKGCHRDPDVTLSLLMHVPSPLHPHPNPECAGLPVQAWVGTTPSRAPPSSYTLWQLNTQ